MSDDLVAARIVAADKVRVVRPGVRDFDRIDAAPARAQIGAPQLQSGSVVAGRSDLLPVITCLMTSSVNAKSSGNR